MKTTKQDYLNWLEEAANSGHYRERFLEMAKIVENKKYIAIFSMLETICTLDNCTPNYMYDAYENHGALFAYTLQDEFKFTNEEMQRLAWGLPQNDEWPRLTGTDSQRSNG